MWARVAVLALPGCAARCDDGIEQVIVLPQEVLTAPSVEVRFQAWAIDTAGRFVQPTPPTKWNGDAAFVTDKTNPTHVSVNAGGDHKVKAKIGKRWSPESVVHGPPSSVETPPGDVIEIEYISPESIADVLVDAKAFGDADCSKANDRLYTIVKAATLPQNLVDGCPTEEIAVFVHDRAPLIEALPATTWTTGSQTLQRPTLPGVVSVATSVWYFVEAESPETQATWELDYANWIHSYNRAGVVLDDIEHHAMGREEIFSGDENCTGIEAALGFTADPARLHIVYVSEIAIFTESPPIGWACPPGAGRGDVVLLKWSPPFATILAHEVVHQMGNSSPPFPFLTAGHVDWYGGDFDVTNIMYINNDPSMEEDRFSLTLGQMYRMHGASHSWINRAKLRPPGATVRVCQGVPDTGECPRLSLRGWRR